MRRLLLVVFFLFVVFSQIFAHQFPDSTEKLFWKEKKQVYEKILKHDIIVSAISRQNHGANQLDFLAAGHVKVPKDALWKRLIQFSEYSSLSDYIKKSQKLANENIWHFVFSAMDFDAHLFLQFRIDEKKNRIHWLNTRGKLKGMEGIIRLDRLDRRTTEFSLDCRFVSLQPIPIPKILLNFGMEVAGYAMFTKMRSRYEEDYKK